MKKVVSIILTLVLVFSLAACGSKENKNTSSNAGSTNQSSNSGAN